MWLFCLQKLFYKTILEELSRIKEGKNWIEKTSLKTI